MSITDIELINFEIKRISSSVSLCLELERVGVYEFITSSTICMTSVSYKLKCQCLNCVISGPGSGTINSQDDFEHFIQRSGSGPYYCQLCSYNNKQFGVVKNHVESKHFPNTFSYQCQQCDTVLGTNTALYRHVQRVHKN